MSLFAGLGRGIGNIWQGYGKGIVGGLVTQYLGQGAGKAYQGIFANKADRRQQRAAEQPFDVSTLWNQISTNSGPTYAAASPGYTADPGLQVASRYQEPIRTQNQVALTSSVPEPQYYDEETDMEEEDYYNEDDYR